MKTGRSTQGCYSCFRETAYLRGQLPRFKPVIEQSISSKEILHCQKEVGYRIPQWLSLEDKTVGVAKQGTTGASVKLDLVLTISTYAESCFQN